MPDHKTVLYSYFRSSASWRVRIALALKHENYEYRAVSLLTNGGQQHSDEHIGLNPMRQLPVLQIDGYTFSQSLPIIEYLDETREGQHILPRDPVLRAQARSIAEIINSGIQPIQNLSVLKRLKHMTGREIAGDLGPEWGGHFIRTGFVGLEKVLEKTSGKFCVGNEITIADLCLVPQVFNANRFKVNMDEFPVINRINEELVQLDAFVTACQSNQPDSPKE